MLGSELCQVAGPFSGRRGWGGWETRQRQGETENHGGEGRESVHRRWLAEIGREEATV